MPETSTAAEFIKVVAEEITHSFGPPQAITSDNATCFSATALKSVMSRPRIVWKPVLSYVSKSNGKAESMVGTMKRSIHDTL